MKIFTKLVRTCDYIIPTMKAIKSFDSETLILWGGRSISSRTHRDGLRWGQRPAVSSDPTSLYTVNMGSGLKSTATAGTLSISTLAVFTSGVKTIRLLFPPVRRADLALGPHHHIPPQLLSLYSPRKKTLLPHLLLSPGPYSLLRALPAGVLRS